MPKETKVATKREVLEKLSAQLRRPELDDKTYIKLLRVFGALSNWEGFDKW